MSSDLLTTAASLLAERARTAPDRTFLTFEDVFGSDAAQAGLAGFGKRKS